MAVGVGDLAAVDVHGVVRPVLRKTESLRESKPAPVSAVNTGYGSPGRQVKARRGNVFGIPTQVLVMVNLITR